MNKDNLEHDKHENMMPEGAGVAVKPIAWFLIILTLSTMLVFVLVKGLTYALDRMEAARTGEPSSRVADSARRTQREPLLQGAPIADPQKPNGRGDSLLPLDDMAAYRKKVEAETTSYGWVAGKENHEARIPIERAKQLLLEKGLPEKAEAAVTELQTAEKTRRQIYGADANGGRIIGKQ
jgi:hypothetical protein